jgi:hypothetical protein
LRRSIESGTANRKTDYDMRNNSYLASLRKLFEEFRMACESGEVTGAAVHELNGETIFRDH